MLTDLVKPYVKNPEVLERINDILKVEFYGFTLPEISAMSFLLVTVIFFFPGRDKRSFLSKLADFLIIWICLITFVVALCGGLLIGNYYDQMAIGGFVGLFVFWLIFNLIGTIKTRIKNKEEREALAKRLGKKV